MEPHVKERIVGAAVLVALGVWLIPWVLDGPDESIDEPDAAPAPGLSLQAVEEAAPRRTETIELQQSARRADSSADAEANDSEPDAEPAQITVAAPESAPALQPESDAESEPVSSLVNPPEPEEAAVVAAPEPDPEPIEVVGWTVQLGAFSDVVNANQLVNRVSTYGYAATVSEFRSGSRIMHRVRVGGFESENAADAAASSLLAHGITAQVIAPE